MNGPDNYWYDWVLRVSTIWCRFILEAMCRKKGEDFRIERSAGVKKGEKDTLVLREEEIGRKRERRGRERDGGRRDLTRDLLAGGDRRNEERTAKQVTRRCFLSEEC